MTDERKRKAAAATRKAAPKATRTADAGKKPAAKKTAVKTAKAVAKSKTPVAKKSKAALEKPKKRKVEEGSGYRVGSLIIDPIGDVTSGEAHTYLGDTKPAANAATVTPANVEMEAFRAETAEDALDATLEAAPELAAAASRAASGTRGIKADSENDAAKDAVEDSTPEAANEPRPPAKLERLQKILSQAGIASRRHAEEMITEGRVIVNGQVVTALGSKADPTRDHIRVDGKLLHGAERHRYFMLNKPKGYVTTVSDPEGRQTVMEFFAGMRERLYPVGRLDYQSEGLLLMTNDGELANLLTKARSGVEKTYLVKVSGQPSEEELERLRAGVAIEKGEEGSERVRTAPARIRAVREGDNPWFEVVLIEGRNRELRKMFSAVGHFVEKIRRVGYGPLVLDLEPGKLRELTQEEVNELRLTAEGKLKPRRMKTPQIPAKEASRSPKAQFDRRSETGGKPEWKSKPRGQRDSRPHDDRAPKREWPARTSEFRPRPGGEGQSGENRNREFRPGAKSDFGGGEKSRFEKRRAKFGPPRGQFRAKPGSKPGFDKPRSARPFAGTKPPFDRPARGPEGFGGPSRPKFGPPRPFRGERPASDARPRFDRPAFSGPPRREGTESPAKPRFDPAGRRPFRAPGDRPSSGPRPRFDRPAFNRSGAPEKRFDRTPGKTFGERPRKDWPEKPRTGAGDAGGERTFAPKGRFEPRSGSRPGGFSKPGGKGPGFRGKFAGGKREGFRPPGKSGEGKKRG